MFSRERDMFVFVLPLRALLFLFSCASMSLYFIFLLLHSLEFMRFDIIDILPFEYVWDDDDVDDDERARFKR